MSLFVNIKKTLGTFKLDATLEVDGVHGLFGASGAGKSTLLACVAGLCVPDDGEIVLKKTIFFSKSKGINLSPEARRTAYAMQAPTLFNNMTVSQNIKIACPYKKERTDKTKELLSLLQIEGQANHYPCQLSQGQMQRATLARAVAANPGVLLLDEPFSALDLDLKSQLEAMVVSLQQKLQIPIIYVSHDLCELGAICNSISIIENGKIIDDTQKLKEHANAIKTRHNALNRF